MSLEDTKSSIFNPRVRREADNGRFQLSPKDYLERYHILKYLQDAIGLMVENKAERPLHFLADYFASIERGVNVLYRSFRYINSTPRNRQSFIQQYYEVYKNISPNEGTHWKHHCTQALQESTSVLHLHHPPHQTSAIISQSSHNHPVNHYASLYLFLCVYADALDVSRAYSR